ncbi:MAG: YebC/PmpR family DNA-binding transcriptional regulator [Phycisphaerales bacterium]|nr:YebC/PmpR family DNA-binding transcriptional regulator [Planctomycetota bacterium]MBL6996904.1 YebC/PmpR family DNA-binding transcriptional regulator [Phycisphaerales bacterium]
MAGHSKWANIKHRKARQDAVKGKAWSKCSRAIMVAVKNGGPDPETNLTLRYAIEDAKAVNMAKDTIEKAIKKASGEGDEGVSYEEVRYEGYGPGGVAILIDVLTDNVNRTAPEMRKLFEKGNGNLAKPGSVAFGFSSTGIIIIEEGETSEEQLMEVALEAGASDIVQSEGVWEVTCEPSDYLELRKAIELAGIPLASSELTMVPASPVVCDIELGTKMLRLIESFEDHEDVQNVYSNADIPEEAMEE